MFRLPYRDTTSLREGASACLMGAFFGSLMLVTVGFTLIRVQLSTGDLFEALPFLPILIGQAFGLFYLVPMGLSALQVIVNRTQHQVEIDKGSILSRERRWLFDYKRKCRIADVCRIRVEHLKNCPRAMHYLSQTCDGNWGVLIFKGRLGEDLLYAAPAYRVDRLVSLATEIAVEVGLESDAVQLAKEFISGAEAEALEEKQRMTSVRDYLAESVSS